jgi:hypothetical protein
MGGELMALLGAFGVFFLCAFVLGRYTMRRKQSGPKSLPTSSLHSPPLPSEFEGSIEDKIAKAAADAYKRQTELLDHEAGESQSAREPMREKLRRARELLKRSGVEESAEYAIGKMKHWHAWYNNQTWRHPPFCRILDGGSRADEVRGRADWVAWEFAGSVFEAEFSNQTSYTGGSDSTRLVLKANNEEVLEVLASWDREYLYADIWGLERLKVGDWMVAFNEFIGQLRRFEQRRREDTASRFERDRASKIDLGEKSE